MADTLIPQELKYTNTHEWIKVEGDTVTMGITDYAQKELSDIVYVELPEAGKSLNQGDVVGTIEAVKAVSDFYSPISGTVIECNTELKTTSDLINKEPYGKGWMVKIKMSKPDELSNLLDATGYEKITVAH
ncbi:MAG: glycine cleavage system protein GcvH [Candidatus Latescibacteria bacterium]|nr:glycine cleavage system protein GcvH [Candidatus Latescibacterota bacterium]